MSIKRHIDIDQGTTYSLTITALDSTGNTITLTGYSANAQIRKYFSSNTSYPFATSVGNTTVTISMSANNTANIEQGRYMYDVIVTSNSGIVTRIIEGIATINPRVTR